MNFESYIAISVTVGCIVVALTVFAFHIAKTHNAIDEMRHRFRDIQDEHAAMHDAEREQRELDRRLPRTKTPRAKPKPSRTITLE